MFNQNNFFGQFNSFGNNSAPAPRFVSQRSSSNVGNGVMRSSIAPNFASSFRNGMFNQILQNPSSGSRFGSGNNAPAADASSTNRFQSNSRSNQQAGNRFSFNNSQSYTMPSRDQSSSTRNNCNHQPTAPAPTPAQDTTTQPEHCNPPVVTAPPPAQDTVPTPAPCPPPVITAPPPAQDTVPTPAPCPPPVVTAPPPAQDTVPTPAPCPPPVVTAPPPAQDTVPTPAPCPPPVVAAPPPAEDTTPTPVPCKPPVVTSPPPAQDTTMPPDCEEPVAPPVASPPPAQDTTPTPAPCAPVPTPPPSYDGGGDASCWGDPHLVGFDGEKYDVMGTAGKTYNMISDKDMQYNTTFIASRNDGANVIGAAGVQVGTSKVSLDASNKTASVDGTAMTVGQKVTLDQGGSAAWDGSTLSVNSSEYNINLAVDDDGTDVNHINSTVKLNGNPFGDGVKPTGLLGQTADGVAGAKNTGVDLGKQGGTVIDGTVTDYEVNGLFDTAFTKNNRFNG